jgi:hypothetical protein
MKKIWLILIMLHLMVFDAFASSGLYSGEVAVAGQGEEDRREAIPDALIQVLQKLSGLHDIPLSDALDEALVNAERIMLSYRYDVVDRTAADGVVSQELRLIANFIPTEVDRIVQRAALPRWRPERSPVQIWVVLDDGISRSLKPLEFAYAWQAIEDVASARGLPVVWPELDEEESQLIDMRLVWGGFTDYLVERGAPGDVVAIMAARREGPDWVLRWNVANEVRTWSWRNSDRELVFALADGVHTMTDQIAASQSIAASEQGVNSLDISIGGLNNADSYVLCLQYLQGVSLVTKVDVLGANPGRVLFRLELNAAAEYLAEAFRLGTVLTPAAADKDYDYEFIQ